MIIKCKMCGGDMELSADKRTGTCEYCGSTMTLPKVDDDQRAAAFNRGNHFRRIGEFDKALSVYESIVREDDKDAEAHWCCALCRFGIEYVKDPASGEYLPTCHRVSFDSFLEDVDYQAALKYADAVARRQYERDAETIAQVQRGILSISQKEKPFDVFICYKESDEKGNRTVDSTLAQDIYYQLTEQGRRVFFARITLEDRAGQEYEPYIFAALHSAKVMIVVGTKPEYLNAVWVKNEWSRYLSLMKNDRKRLLIPCYRDMDPYDLPEQLSVLQSYDMGKIGFIQDLIRGIAKVLDADKKSEEKVIERVIEHGSGTAAPGIDSLMQRAYLFMEDGDFSSADEYLNRVLDIDPNYAPAYAAKTCTALKFRREKDLGEATFLYKSNADWKKALRFASSEQKKVYEDYQERTEERVLRQIRDFTYDATIALLARADGIGNFDGDALEKYVRSCETTDLRQRADGTRRSDWKENEQIFLKNVKANEPEEIREEVYKAAAGMFQGLKDEEGEERAKQCLVLAEQARQKKIYLEAEKLGESAERERDAHNLRKAEEVFRSVPDYKDAKQRADECGRRAAEMQEEDYQEALKAMQSAGTASFEWSGFGGVISKLSQKNLDGYKDIETLRAEAEAKNKQYQEAEARIAARNQEIAKARRKRNTIIAGAAAAAAALVVAAGFFVNKNVIQPTLKYNHAQTLLAAGKYDDAKAAFSELQGFKDVTEDTLKEVTYQKAQALLAAGDFDGAYREFRQVKGFQDVDVLLSQNEDLIKAKEEIFTVGNLVTFGSYEQDNDTANGKEAIEWIVLARNEEQALLLSKQALDVVPYNKKYVDITWEKSSIRSWLNGTFLDEAFTQEEQSAISVTSVDNSQSQGYSNWDTNGGNDTQDKVFLLSYKEAFEDCFSSDSERICKPTSYAENQGAYVSDEGNCWWWLRSPGSYQPLAACVSSSGDRNYNYVYFDFCVRPALWINLDSDIF